ncbi:MAG: hypothetical protein AB1458_13115 [Bacteroidota bacterium]
MADLDLTLTSLQSKIEKIVHLHRKLQDDYSKLADENAELRKALEDQKSEINKLEEKNKIIKLAKTLSENNENNSTELKYKINELMREIDKSIALLNK